MAPALRLLPRSGPVWQAVPPPVRPRRRPEVVRVRDAFLSPVATGRLATVHRPDSWFRGAVYDHDGQLVRASQKFLGDRRGPRVAADPDTIERTPAPVLSGTWLYGGTWARVFGHFLVETLTTLWPTDVPSPDGLVFHSSFGNTRVDDWHRRLLDLAGWGDLPVHVVGKQEPVGVEDLVVPSRSVALHAWAHPEARQVWDTVAERFRGTGGSDLVYVSRTLINERRRTDGHRRPVRTSAETDQQLDEVFAERGFTVLRPETLDVDEQLRAVASASVIAGLSGSGLHHSAFIPRGGRVLEMGDGRSSTRPVRMQVAIDAVSGHRRCFVPGDTSPGQLARTLRRLGL